MTYRSTFSTQNKGFCFCNALNLVEWYFYNMASAAKQQLPRKRPKYVKINITRPVYTEKEFRKKYDQIEDERTWTQQVKDSFGNISITRASLWTFVKKLLPIISWLPKYSLVDDGIHDVLAGVTVAIMRIPQGNVNLFSLCFVNGQ